MGVSPVSTRGVRYAIVPYASETTTLLHLKEGTSADYVIKALDKVHVNAEDLGKLEILTIMSWNWTKIV